MYKLTLDFPNLAKGAEVQIPGLGVFENGYKYDVDDALADSYRQHHTHVVDDFEGDGVLVGRHVEQGPTLLQAFKDHPGVLVETPTKSRAKVKVKAKTKPEPETTDDVPEGGVS